MHGGMKFYRGAAGAARAYVEPDRARVRRLLPRRGQRRRDAVRRHTPDDGVDVARELDMDGETYEQWVAGVRRRDRAAEGAAAQGRERRCGSSRSRSTARRPGRWRPRCIPRSSAALDAAQDAAAEEIIGWLAEHATTRVGPRGRQVQVPVEQIEAAVVRHYTSRAGDPHRHLHLQINARVCAAGAVARAAHGRGPRQHRGDQRHRPRRRGDRPASSGRRSPRTGTPSIPRPVRSPSWRRTSARSAPGPRRSSRNIDRYEAEWRAEHPGEEPGPRLREAWDRRAWAEARPDKVVPTDGAELVAAVERGAARRSATRDPAAAGCRSEPAPVGWHRPRRRRSSSVARPGSGARRSAWNAADIRGEVESAARPDRRGRRRRGPGRARRGPHRPRRRPLHAAARPRPTCPNTSGR